jgi:hypothetical protein
LLASSALIHDLDHQGIPNMVLVQEKSPLALQYNNKSVAEQNSGMHQREMMVSMYWHMVNHV